MKEESSIGHQVGVDVDWYISSEEKADVIRDVIRDENITNVHVIPKD